MEKKLVIDCPPGFPRPSDLLHKVLEGTEIPVKDNPDWMLMGEFGWVYTDEEVTDEQWEKSRPIIYDRLVKLHNNNVIRFGSISKQEGAE